MCALALAHLVINKTEINKLEIAKMVLRNVAKKVKMSYLLHVL
jgi:hypothetical protein